DIPVTMQNLHSRLDMHGRINAASAGMRRSGPWRSPMCRPFKSVQRREHTRCQSPIESIRAAIYLFRGSLVNLPREWTIESIRVAS
ncbi:MAG: hypothetical protein QGF90_06675, partial [Gammaproteobacteria bacterium]|nr:hypothetical protein [Gammaproteobacteria bacterium]